MSEDPVKLLKRALVAEAHRARLMTRLEAVCDRPGHDTIAAGLVCIGETMTELRKVALSPAETREVLDYVRREWLAKGGAPARRLLDPGFYRKVAETTTDPVVRDQASEMAVFVEDEGRF